MASSRLDESIYYNEHRKPYEEDLGYASSVYELDIQNVTISVVIGRPKLNYSNKNILFFPIYVLTPEEQIGGQIGVFEIRARPTDITRYTNSELEIDEEKLGEPILFGFAKQPGYLEKFRVDGPVEEAEDAEDAEDAEEVETEAETEAETEEDEEPLNPADDSTAAMQPPQAAQDDIDDMFNLEVRKDPDIDYNDTTTYKIRNMSKIFTISKDVHPLPHLSEETVLETKKYRKEYEETTSTSWVERFFKNNFYAVEENPANGDCFFYVVRDAFAQLGYMTTIEKLREIVAAAATPEVFENYRTLYTGIRNIVTESTEVAKKILKLNTQLKRSIDSAASKEESDVYLAKAQDNNREYEEHKKTIRTAKQNLQEFEFMEGIDNLEKLRIVMRTPKYWADAFAIAALERALRVKFMILSEESFKEDALDFVLECGEKIDNFRPVFYVVTAYSGNHYRLVSYKSKKILRFAEIPHALKVLVMNKCMENLASAYGEIPEFRALKQHYNIQDEDEEAAGAAAAENAPPSGVSPESLDLYDRDTVFMFHVRSADKKIGHGAGETVPVESIDLYHKLQLIPHWRRKLDDSYVSSASASTDSGVFELHGKRWAAPEIYYQASKFRHQNTAFYETFSLDSGSEYSRNVELARIAGGLHGRGDVKQADGTTKRVVLRNKNIKIDPGFYSVSAVDGLANNQKERRAAIVAKFSQNAEMGRILELTRRALLVHYQPRTKRATPDIELMEVREELSSRRDATESGGENDIGSPL